MGNLLQLGDEVRIKGKRYEKLKLHVVGIMGDRISVERIDQHKKGWRRYEDACDLVKVDG